MTNPVSAGAGDSGIPRLSTRLAVELIADSFEHYDEPRALFAYLRDKGFSPELLRTKGYLNLPSIVAVVPAYSTNLRQFAAISVRRIFNDGGGADEIGAAGTIVSVDTVMTPTDFKLLRVDGGRVVETGPVTFSDLSRDGFASVLTAHRIDHAGVIFSQVTRGRGLAPIVLQDMVNDEVRAGYLTESEANLVLGHAELSADIARMHAYVAEALRAKAGGCSACCSSSCFGCTSCSCVIFSRASTSAQ